MLRGVLVAWLGLVACHRAEPTPAPAPSDAGLAVRPGPLVPQRGDQAFRCLLERGLTGSQAIALVGESASNAAVQRAVDLAVDAAAPDPAHVSEVLVGAIETQHANHDVAGLRTSLLRLDALPPDPSHRAFGAERVRVGLPVTPAEIVASQEAVALELALAGNIATASALVATLPSRDSNVVAPLIALGRVDEVRAMMAATNREARDYMARLWSLTALRMPGSPDVALRELRTAVHADPDIDFELLALARVARRLGRTGLTGFRALADDARPWATTEISDVAARRAYLHELAVELGADGLRYEMETLEQGTHMAVLHGSIGDALTAAATEDDPNGDLARIWGRAYTAGIDSATDAQLARGICLGDETPPREGYVLEVRDKPHAARFECSATDVILSLRDETGRVVDTRTFEGGCEGACTRAARAKEKREQAELQIEIDRGEADPALLNYSFGVCWPWGPKAGASGVETFEDRPLAQIPWLSSGAHDSALVGTVFALEVCGKILVVDGADKHPDGFDPTAPEVETVTRAGRLLQLAAARVTLPTCPGAARVTMP